MIIQNPLVNNIIILIVWFLLLVSSYTDLRYRIISNRIVIAIFVLAVCNYLFGSGIINYLAAIIFLILGLIFFYCRLIGAGDVKLIAVLLLTVPANYVYFYLIMITLVGFPLAICALIYKAFTKKTVTLPYGIAISGGYFFTSFMMFTNVVNKFAIP